VRVGREVGRKVCAPDEGDSPRTGPGGPPAAPTG